MESTLRGGWWVGWLLLLHRRRDRVSGRRGLARAVTGASWRCWRDDPGSDPLRTRTPVHAPVLRQGPPWSSCGAVRVPSWLAPQTRTNRHAQQHGTVPRAGQNTRVRNPHTKYESPVGTIALAAISKGWGGALPRALDEGEAALGGGRDRHANARMAQGGWGPRGVERGDRAAREGAGLGARDGAAVPRGAARRGPVLAAAGARAGCA